MIHSSMEGAATNNRLVDVAECRSLSAFCVCARKVARDALFSILSPSRDRVHVVAGERENIVSERGGEHVELWN